MQLIQQRANVPKLAFQAARHKRLDFLDALRGIAALVVFVAHAGEVLSPAFQHFRFTWFDLGSFGVVVFFLCSGFVIPMSLERHRSLTRFWTQRVFRLYPLYWCSLLLLFVSYVLGRYPIHLAVIPERWATVAGNITMLQMFLGEPHLLQLYWTLAFEMLFYVVVSVFFLCKLSHRTVAITVGMILSAGLSEGALPLLTDGGAPLGTLSSLATMFVGTTLYRVHSGAVSGRIGCGVVAAAGAMLVATTLGSGVAHGDLWLYRYLLTAQVGAYLMFGLAYLLQARPVPRFLRGLGYISYSLYLMHPFVIVLTPQLGSRVATLLVWLLVLVVLATLTYRWIEQPAIGYGRRLTGRSRKRTYPVLS